jgi:hypothetical protein
MKQTVLFITILIAFTISSFGQSQASAQVKTDWDQDELKGKVKSITVERVTFSEKFGKWEESDRTMESVKSYDEKGTSIDIQNYADGVPTLKITFKHDDSGRISGGDLSDAGGNFAGKQLYSFDGRGNLVEDASYSGDGSLDQKLIFTFDNAHNPISVVVYSSDGQVMETVKYLYDKTHGITETDEYDANAALSGKSIQKHDAKGLETTETYYAADGSIAWIKTYKYDIAGNWAKSTITNRVTKFGKTYDEPSSAEYRTIEYYP